MSRQITFLLFLSILQVGNAYGLSTQCQHAPQVNVVADNAADLSEVCASAERALKFLAGYKLIPQRSIHFTIVDAEIDGHGYDAFGSYDSRTDRIQLMSYQAIFARTKNPQMYGEPFDRTHYAGAIAHEIAHAVVQHNLKEKPISPGPQEYLAHATQLGVLPEERRQKILDAMAVSPWESGDVLSDIYMALEPGKFAAKSYLHLTTTENPEAFINILLNSKWFYVYVP